MPLPQIASVRFHVTALVKFLMTAELMYHMRANLKFQTTELKFHTKVEIKDFITAKASLNKARTQQITLLCTWYHPSHPPNWKIREWVRAAPSRNRGYNFIVACANNFKLTQGTIQDVPTHELALKMDTWTNIHHKLGTYYPFYAIWLLSRCSF